MQQRTEEQKVALASVFVILGGKEYEVKPLPLGESRIWKQQFAKLLTTGFSQIKTDAAEPEKYAAALLSFIIDSPETIIDLFFSYAKDLNREEIEKIATEAEVGVAWEKVREVAFPLAQTLVQTMGKMLP